MDTGYHSDQTKAALLLLKEPFGEEAIRVVQIANYLPDFYDVLADKVSWIYTILNALLEAEEVAVQIQFGVRKDSFKPTNFGLRCSLLHFDNLNDLEAVRKYAGNLVLNAKSLLVEASKNKETLKGLLVLGVFLHATQDFYSHSTWISVNGLEQDEAGQLPDRPAKVPVTTLYERLAGELKSPLMTGKYGKGIPPADEREKTYHFGLNHDYAQRKDFVQAYVLGICASRQILDTAKEWVGNDFWKSMREFRADDNYEKDARMTRDTSLHAGHWKGPSLLKRLSVFGRTVEWGISDTPLFKTFKSTGFLDALVRGLQGPQSVADKLPTFKPLTEAYRTVELHIVTITCSVHHSPQPLVTIGDRVFEESPAWRLTVAGPELPEDLEAGVQARKAPARWTCVHLVPADQKKVKIQLRVANATTTVTEDVGEGRKRVIVLPGFFNIAGPDATACSFTLDCDNLQLKGDFVDGVHGRPDKAATVQGSGDFSAQVKFFATSRLVGGSL